MKDLVAIDIGNSRVKFGSFKDGDLLERASSPLSEIRGATTAFVRGRDVPIVVASVVPAAAEVLREVLVGRDVRWVQAEQQDVVSGVDSTMGADRLADAVAAWKIYGKGRKAVAVVGLGTATTMLVVNGKGRVLGGFIAPGLGLTLASMHEQTALLPLLQMQGQTDKLGFDTESHMRNGVFVGHCGLVRQWLKTARKAAGDKVIRVATGGWSEAVSAAFPEGKVFDVVDRDLTLKGIFILAKAGGDL